MRNLLLVFLIFVASYAEAQTTVTCLNEYKSKDKKIDWRKAKICQASLQSDLDSLREIILASHPDPYAFCGKEKFDNTFEAAKRGINRDMTLFEYSFVLSSVIKVMHDSHASVGVISLMQRTLHNQGGIVPLPVECIDGKFFVYRDTQNLKSGMRILSVNGFDMKIIHEMAKLWVTIEGDAYDAEDYLALYYYTTALYFMKPMEAGQSIDVVYQDLKSDGSFSEKRTLSLNALGYSEFKQYVKARSKEKEEIETAWYPNQEKAVLTIRTFYPASTRKAYKKIRTFIAEVKEKNYELAIDIRDNGGGQSTFVEWLCAYFDSTGCNTPSNIIWKGSDLSTGAKLLYMEKHFPKLFEKLIKSNRDLYSYVRITRTKKGEVDTAYFKDPYMQRASLIYTKNVTVFANYGSASASVDFVHRMGGLPQVTVIGTPVLGPHTGTWGNANMTTLEKTGIGIAVPTIRYNYDNSFMYYRTPIRPDVEIQNNPKDWLEHKDTVLEYFLAH